MKENIIKTYTNKYLMFKDFPKEHSYSIRDIFIEHWSNFCEYANINNLNIRDIVYFEVAKMMKCKTPQLGFSLYECPECHNTHIQFHTCKSKFCTSCGNKYSKDRVISIESKLYNCNHRHLVFTIHDALWNLFREDRNRLNLLFEAVNITLSSWCKEKYGKHGFKLGFVLTLHTFGRDDKWNPHIHALIAELLVKNNNCKRFDFFPYDMLRKRFQKVMLDLLEKNIGKQKFRQLKNKVYSTSKNGFYVRAKKNENLGTKQNVEYVLRYCGRPAFAASKILNIKGDYITFWYQRHEDNLFGVETIHIFEFIKRIIIHIPEYQFKTIRYYGFYSKKSKFHDKMIMLVHPKKTEFARKFNKWFLLSLKTFNDSPLICSKCKTVMQFQYRCTKWRLA